ncbi:phospholipase [Planomonospora sp. ID82291]|uniref:phospholipase n=1 Tax=Planomonospora sp. ID82291 TaxID=2738136 RepID=UPI0018C3B479|nr:phospholipase [Planomonospora sp. ID82291]MBG0814896.1 hypothetical protein [Planomonospora sp. ID82291]
MTDRYLFDSSLADFSAASDEKRDRPDEPLIWSSDDCSFIGDQGVFDFTASCRRHDFGYRNYKQQNRFTKEGRRRIDENFRNDMNATCNRYSGWRSAQGVVCRAEARAYYSFVRVVGRAHPIRSVFLFGRRIRLYVSSDDPYASGYLSNGSPRDSVWLDRSGDGGRTWEQLHVTRVPWKMRRALTFPVRSAGYTLRACGKAGNRSEIACTEWVAL